MRLCRATTFMVLALGTGLIGSATAASSSGQAPPATEPARKFDFEVRLMVWADSSEPESLPNQEERIDDFFVRRARLALQGRLSESLSFSLQLGQDNTGAKVLTEDGSIRIKDAYVNYQPYEAFQITVGQFKVPFLRANLESGFNQLLVDRGTLPSFRPAREGSRDLGVMAWGNVEGVQYRAALFDGSDQEARNSRSRLRGTARIAYNWFTKETGLATAGTYIGARRVLQLAAQLDAQDSRLDARDESAFQTRPRDYRSYALEGFFEQPFAGGWAITAEGAWFDRRDEYLDPAISPRSVKGYYAQAGLLLPGRVGPGRLQPAFRWEDWHTDRGSLDTTTSRTTAGATYYLEGHSRKLQADYTWKQETVAIRNDEFRLSLALVF